MTLEKLQEAKNIEVLIGLKKRNKEKLGIAKIHLLDDFDESKNGVNVIIRGNKHSCEMMISKHGMIDLIDNEISAMEQEIEELMDTLAGF